MLLLLYFALQIVIRLLVSDSADRDEADQLVQTQKLSWGYGPQPPLYTWIQLAFIGAFGLNLFSIALLKNLLLFGTYLLTYFNARAATNRHDCGVAAAASLLFLPQFAWESQRDLNHSVLVSTLAAATLSCFFLLRSRPGLISYVALGVCAGLGLLSKFNYIVLLVGLVLAAVSLPEWRTIVLDRRMVIVPAVALLMFLPTGLWILHHRDLAYETLYKLHVRPSESLLRVVHIGLANATVATLIFLGPATTIPLAIFWKKRGRGMFNLQSAYSRLMLRMLLAVCSLVVAGILIFRATEFQERWLLPILISWPVLTLTLLQQHLDRPRFKIILWLAAVIMISISVCLPGRILLAERLHRTEPLNRPYVEFAQQLQGPLTNLSMVVVDNRLLGGNLRLSLPDKTFFTPDLAPIFLEPDRRCALLWDTSLTGSMPWSLLEFARRRGLDDLTNAQPRYFSATFKYHRARQMRIGLLVPAEP